MILMKTETKAAAAAILTIKTETGTNDIVMEISELLKDNCKTRTIAENVSGTTLSFVYAIGNVAAPTKKDKAPEQQPEPDGKNKIVIYAVQPITETIIDIVKRHYANYRIITDTDSTQIILTITEKPQPVLTSFDIEILNYIKDHNRKETIERFGVSTGYLIRVKKKAKQIEEMQQQKPRKK